MKNPTLSFALLSVLFLYAGCSDSIAAPDSEGVSSSANAKGKGGKSGKSGKSGKGASGGGGLTRTVFAGTCLKDHIPGFSTVGEIRDGDVILDPTITLDDPPVVTAFVINDFPPGGGTLNVFFDDVFVQEGRIVILCDGGFTDEFGTVFPAWDYRIVMIK